jgi:hypothetical protein
MHTVQQKRGNSAIVYQNNLLLLFARARAWATLALVDPARGMI